MDRLSGLKIKGRILRNVLLKRFTSFRIGGIADFLIIPEDIEDMKAILDYLGKRGLSYLLLGGGTNILVMDEGVKEVIIKLPSTLNRIELLDGERVYAEAHVPLDKLLKFSVDNSLTGLEFLSGIPGRLGGAIRMNAGTYRGDMGGVVESITVMDRDGRIRTLPRDKLRFLYRELVLDEGEIILSGIIRLNKGDRREILRRIELMRYYRGRTQPLSYPSAGSVFKNPPGMKAGSLIEEAGLKGFRIGGAKVSEIHANFIINLGGARASDVIGIMKHIQQRVYEDKGIKLIPEIKIWGGNPLG